MRNPVYMALAGLLLLFASCQKEISFIAPPATGTSPITATVQGNIVDENGSPAPGVTIKVGSKTAITDAKGYFRIRNASLDKATSLVTAEKAGYFKAFRVFAASKAVNQVKIKLLKKVLTGSVPSTGGGTITLANGSSLQFNANSFARSGGAAYSGTVNVYAAFVDPTSQDIGETVPGSFLADDKDNKRVILTSYAMMAVELETPAGEKLNIASGSTAKLNFSVPAGLQSSAPASLSLWYVDETTGRWKEEGTAVKNGNIYTGEVKHFTYWNCDAPGPTVNCTATFVNQNGQPLIYTSVLIRPANGYGCAHGFTDSLGQISGPIPANMNLVLEVQAPYPCFSIVYSQNIGPFSADVNLGTITVNTTQYLLTVEGKVVNCNNNPVSNGFAEIEYDNVVRYARTNATGDFSVTFVNCGQGAPACTIVGADSLTQQQGMPTTVTITSPVTHAGNIIACGTSSIQFMNYTIDGGSQVNLISTNPGDSFTASDTTGTQHRTYLNGYRSQTQYLSLDFDSPGTPGTYALHYLSLDGYGQVTPLASCNLILTAFPQPGGFFEGTFSGQFKDALNNTHSLNGSLRIKLR